MGTIPTVVSTADCGYPGYNIYGNFGVYGYPGSGIEGGASNPGYDPGHGGYPSFGGYGITNRMIATPAFGSRRPWRSGNR